MNLAEFRQAYPQYDGVSDDELSTRLYKKYYADKMPAEAFHAKFVGAPVSTPEVPSTTGGQPAAVDKEESLGGLENLGASANEKPDVVSNFGNVAKASAHQLAGGVARLGELAYTPTAEKFTGPSWTESAKKVWSGLSEFGKAMFDPAEWNPETRTQATLHGLDVASTGTGELGGHALHALRQAPGTGGAAPVSAESKRTIESMGPGTEVSDWSAKAQQDATQALSPEVQASIQKHAIEHSENGYHFGEGVTDPWWWTNGVVNAAESMLPGIAATKMASITTYATQFPKYVAKAEARKAPHSLVIRYATLQSQKDAARAAVIAGGLSEGTIGGGTNAQQTEQTINQLDETTMNNYAGYRELRKQGMGHEAARAEVARDKAFAVGLATAVVDGITGAPLNARMAKWATDTGLNKATSRSRAALEGTLGEGLQEAAQGSLEQIVQNRAEQPITGKGTWEDVLDQAVQGFFFAAPGGGVMGAASGGQKTIKTEQTPADLALRRARDAYTAAQQKLSETEANAANPAVKVTHADLVAAREEHQIASVAMAQAALNTGRLDAKTQQVVADALQKAKAAGIEVPNETVEQPVDVNRKPEESGKKETGVAPKPLNADEQAHLTSLDAVADAESMDSDTLHKMVADKLVKMSPEGKPVLLPEGRRQRKALNDRVAVAAEEAAAEESVQKPAVSTKPEQPKKVNAPLKAKKPRKPKVDVAGAIDVITGRQPTQEELDKAETNVRVAAVSSEGTSLGVMKEAFANAKRKPSAGVPFVPAVKVAQTYKKAAKITMPEPVGETRVDPKRGKRIADAFEAMQHNPNDPKVKRAYEALNKETADQWQAIKKTGLKVEFIKPGQADPYAENPRKAIEDVRNNNHLWVFPTEGGFGEGGENADYRKDNPMLQATGEVVDGHHLLTNDIFRIVHDYFGHVQHGNGFRANGEEHAWRVHAAMYSPEARAAMTTETRGQNSWVNFGPHGETNRTAKTGETKYAPQKIGLLPEELQSEAPAREAAASIGRVRIPGFEPGAKAAAKPTTYEKFYDRSAKTWTVQRKDAAGNQIGDASHVYSKPEADAEIARMKRDDNTNVLRFKHFSPADEAELELNPARQGTGLRGEERKRGGAQVTSLYAENGEVESELQNQNQYNVEVPERDMYDANMDPLNLRSKARVPVSFTAGENGTLVPGDERFDFNEYERLIKEAGYKGYHTPRAEGVLKGQARMFGPVKATRAKVARASVGRVMPATAPVFNKGDRVYRFKSWDNKGTFTVEEFTVGSWGKAQAHLVRGSGDTLHRRIYTAQANGEIGGEHVYKVGEVDPEAKAKELAAQFLVSERQRLERLLASTSPSYQDPAYKRSIQKSLDALHEPEVINRTQGAQPEVRASLGKKVSPEAALRKVAGLLTPEERSRLNTATAQRLVDIFNELPDEKDLAAAAIAGQAKRGWYEKSAKAITNVFGADAPRFAALLAALSPQTSVEQNFKNAVAVFVAWDKAGRPQDRTAITRIMRFNLFPGDNRTGKVGVLPAWIGNAVRALTSETPDTVTLSGPKVDSFAANLRGETNRVTLDAWMANFANVDQKIFKGEMTPTGGAGLRPGYLAYTARVRQAAQRLSTLTGETWTPAEVQETVWSWAKTLYEQADKYGALGTAQEILDDGVLTDELINASPDFATLFADPAQQKFLRDSGYGQQLDQLAGAQGEPGAVRKTTAPLEGDSARLRRAAGRLDALKAKRVASEQETREANASISKNRIRPGTGIGTQNFRKWFGKSKVVDSYGNPMTVYHAARAEITAFDANRGVNNFVGKGIYFTDESEDVNDNYALTHLDKYNKIDVREKEILDAFLAANTELTEEEEEEAAESAAQQALREFEEAAPVVYAGYLSLQNPLRMHPQQPGRVGVYDKTLNTQIDPTEFWDAYQRQYPEETAARYFRPEFAEKIDDPENTDPIYGDELRNEFFGNGEFAEAIGGPEAAADMFQAVLKELGFDGVAHTGAHFQRDHGSTHYVAFAPEQFKAYYNSGTWSPDTADMAASATEKAQIEAGGIHPDVAREVAKQVSDALGVPVNVAETQADLPREANQFLAAGLNVNGMFIEDPTSPNGGEMWIVAESTGSREEALETAIHETAGHLGTRALLGDKWNETMDAVAKSFPKELQDIANEYGLLINHSDPRVAAKSRRTAADELIAYAAGRVLARNGVESKLGVWSKIVAYVRDALRKVGLISKYNDEDINAVIYRARDALKYSKRKNMPERIRYESEVAQAASLAPYLEQTKTPAFKRWFKGSKIVDENGLPKRMYHSTSSTIDFDAFDPAFSDDIGMHFGTAGQAEARVHGTVHGNMREHMAPRTIPVYLNIENPVQLPDLITWPIEEVLMMLEGDEVINERTRERILDSSDNVAELWAVLKEKGYDGVVYKNAGEISGMPALDDEHMRLSTEMGRAYNEMDDDDKAQVFGVLDHVLVAPAGTYSEDLTRYAEIYHRREMIGKQKAALRASGMENSYIVFDPRQIKSAVGNQGTFDPAERSIAASIGKQVGPTGNTHLDSFLNKMGAEKPTLRQRWNDFRENLGGKIAQAAFDQFHGIKRASTVAGIAVGDSGYMDARLSGNSAELVQSMMEYGHPVWTGGAPDVAGGRGFLSILQPLGDKVNLWLGYQVALRASRLASEGRENLFTPEEIKAGLDLAKQHPEFVVVSKEYGAFQKKVLDFAQEAGVINPNSRALWENQDYVPFYRMVENGEVSQHANGGKGLGFVRNQIKQLKGGTDKIGDPMENITRNWLALVDASLKAHAARNVVDAFDGTGLVVKDPAPIQQTILPKALFLKSLAQNPTLAANLKAANIDPRRMSEAQIRGLQQMFVAPVPNEEGKISVWRNGQREHWTIHDTMLFQSLQGISSKAWGPLMNLLRAPKRLLTATVTIVPQFAVKNVWRDMWHTFIIGTNDGRTITPLVDTVKGTIASMKMNPAAQSMLAGGASFSHGYIHGGNPGAGAAAVRRTLKAHHKGPGMLLDSPLKLFRFYRKLLNASENANRVAIYNKALAAGKTRKEALYEARDILDFSMRGANPAVRLLVESVPFFNARLQGLYRLGRGFHKGTAAGIFMRGSLLAALSLALLARNWKDDRYKELSNDQKGNYWHMFDVLQPGDHWKIPKPFETGAVFGTIPEAIGDAFLTNADEPDAAAQAAQLVAFAFEQQLNMSPQPQAIWPMLELAINKNSYTGSPILTEGDKGILPEDQVGPNTAPTYRAIAQAMPEFAPEALRSPKQLEHLGRGYIGNVQDYVLLMTDKLVRDINGEPAPPKTSASDWPGLRDFRTTGPSRHTKYMDSMYDIADEAELAYQSMHKAEQADTEEGDKRADEIEAKYGNVLDVREDFRKAVTEVSALKKEQRQIQLDEAMTPAEKREEIDAIQQDINDIAKDVYDLRPGGKLNPEVGAELLVAPPKKRAQILQQNGMPATAELLRQAGQ